MCDSFFCLSGLQHPVLSSLECEAFKPSSIPLVSLESGIFSSNSDMDLSTERDRQSGNLLSFSQTSSFNTASSVSKESSGAQGVGMQCIQSLPTQMPFQRNEPTGTLAQAGLPCVTSNGFLSLCPTFQLASNPSAQSTFLSAMPREMFTTAAPSQMALPIPDYRHAVPCFPTQAHAVSVPYPTAAPMPAIFPSVPEAAPKPLSHTRQAAVVTRRVSSEGKNLFVSHLPLDVTDRKLYQMFAPFGTILRVRVLPDIHTGGGVAAVLYFNDKEAVEAAKQAMDGFQLPDGNVLSVKVAHQGATFILEETNRIFVRKVPPTLTSDDLARFFLPYGKVLECSIHKDVSYRGVMEGTTLRMAYLTFETIEEATAACTATNGTIPWPAPLYNGEVSPLIVKPAETLECRNARLRRSQKRGLATQKDVEQIPGTALSNSSTTTSSTPTFTGPTVMFPQVFTAFPGTPVF